MTDLKASQRRGLIRKVKLWLRRPATFKAGAFVLNIIDLIVRFINLFK